MKGFVFRLQRVLQLRATKEQERAEVLGLAMRDEQRHRVSVTEASERLARCGDQLMQAGGPATAGALRNLGLTVQAALDRVEAAEDSHRSAHDTVKDEQKRFGEARRDRRIIERLREKKKADWDMELSRQEQKEHDGLAQHRRRTGGAP